MSFTRTHSGGVVSTPIFIFLVPEAPRLTCVRSLCGGWGTGGSSMFKLVGRAIGPAQPAFWGPESRLSTVFVTRH